MISRKLGTIAVTCLAVATLSTAAACGSGGGTEAGQEPTSAAPAASSASGPAGSVSASAASSASAVAAVIYTCGRQAVSRPATLDISCHGGTASLIGLTWSHWGSASASAVGKYRGVPCSPDCAKGAQHTISTTVTVSAYELRNGSYAEMTVIAPDRALPLLQYSLGSSGPSPQE